MGQPDIGQLKQRVSTQQQTLLADGQGGNTATWGTLIETWAKITPLSAQQRIYAGQAGTEISHKVMMRYRSDLVAHYAGSVAEVTRRYRLLYGARILVIAGVRILDEGMRFIELACNEKGAV